MTAAQTKMGVFVVVTLASFFVAAGYTFYASRASRSSRSPVPAEARPQPAPSPSMPTPAEPIAAPTRGQAKPSPISEVHAPAAPAQPYVIALNMRESPERGQVEFFALDTVGARTTTGLRCERTYFAGGKGVCLSREIKFYAAESVATFTDDRFQPLFDVRTPGIPSRARISRDGRRAAFTVFVSGHSYADPALSTTTLLVDLTTQQTIANLEAFQVWKDGRAIKALDFNYWGVTFERDSNFFYATLRTAGVNYLVRGDIMARAVTVVFPGVECPSLSPDETRVAFKKAVGRFEWRLAVLDLESFEVVTLPEMRSVDDQAEWLDNTRVLYGMPDPAPWMTIMVTAADGTGQPAVFAKGAASPAVVPQFRP
jgi:hypothetical protein